ncbi:hypothetical protein CEXT_458071 [Caerostris extrusa]|uniref:Ribosomal protein L32 n=1 Tax=Caerostris extrusa TaxID=172846 RepID=A0AAV4WV15_CAEEX|nr:hypothetical protein CEXT_458071 [Caerostris extrusa]
MGCKTKAIDFLSEPKTQEMTSNSTTIHQSRNVQWLKIKIPLPKTCEEGGAAAGVVVQKATKRQSQNRLLSTPFGQFLKKKSFKRPEMAHGLYGPRTLDRTQFGASSKAVLGDCWRSCHRISAVNLEPPIITRGKGARDSIAP